MFFFVTGYRGDWKALRQAFNFNRYADRDQVGILKDKVWKFCLQDCNPLTSVIPCADMLGLRREQGPAGHEHVLHRLG